MSDTVFQVKNGINVANGVMTVNSTSLIYNANAIFNSSFNTVMIQSSSYVQVAGSTLLNNNQLYNGTGTLYIQNAGALYGLNLSAANCATTVLGNLTVNQNFAVSGNVSITGTFAANTVSFNSISVNNINVSGNFTCPSTFNLFNPVAFGSAANSVNLQGLTYVSSAYNGYTVPAGGQGGAISWNQSQGQGETDFFNLYYGNPAGVQFRFLGKTGANSAQTVLDLSGPGSTSIFVSNVSAAGFTTTGVGQFGAVSTTNNIYAGSTICSDVNGAQFISRGYMHYSDGANYYILLTGTNTPTTTFNGARPFFINLTSGLVQMGNGLSVNSITLAGSALVQASAAQILAGVDNTAFVTSYGLAASTVANILPSAGSYSMNCAASTVFKVTLSGNVTMGTPVNPINGRSYIIWIKQPSSGGPFTVAWSSAFLWPSNYAPNLSTTNNYRDMITATYDASTGNFICTSSLGYTS